MDYDPVKAQKKRTKSFGKIITSLLGRKSIVDSTASVNELNGFISSASLDPTTKTYVVTSTEAKGDVLILGSSGLNAEATSESSAPGTCRRKRKKNSKDGLTGRRAQEAEQSVSSEGMTTQDEPAR